MTPNDQERFIGNVRSALRLSPNDTRCFQDLVAQASDEYAALIPRIKNRSDAERLELLDRLIEEGKTLNLEVIPLPDAESVASAIAQLVEEKEPEWGSTKSVVAWQHPLIERLDLAKAMAGQKVPVYVTRLEHAPDGELPPDASRRRLRTQVIDSFIGVTSADFCLADTATLVMKTRPNQPRSVSLVPSIHVAVIELRQIIENLGELYTLLKYDPVANAEGLTNCMTFISGPSKTGDIELVLIHGAHGPRELHLYVITGS
ncbi:MAG: lactate utilization protein [Deltaproteobacteria bacterium]